MDVAKPKNCETGTLPCKTADAIQGAWGWFLVGAAGRGRHAERMRKRTPDEPRHVGEDTAGEVPTPIPGRMLAQVRCAI
jgi:hypothetical protein